MNYRVSTALLNQQKPHHSMLAGYNYEKSSNDSSSESSITEGKKG